MLLVRQFRMEWPNQTLLTADDTEFIRSAIDIALSTAGHEGHTGDIYDLNSTTWAIWMVQQVYAVRKEAWTAESEQAQYVLTFLRTFTTGSKPSMPEARISTSRIKRPSSCFIGTSFPSRR